MSITKESKKEIISQFAINKKDTGSAEVQIAVISERIINLIDHFNNHKHDKHSRSCKSSRKFTIQYCHSIIITDALRSKSMAFTDNNDTVGGSRKDLCIT